MKSYQSIFYLREQAWFEKLKPFLIDSKERIIKIGNGAGYLSEMIRLVCADTTVLEIVVGDNTVNKNNVQLYNGEHIPYDDKSFDVCVFNLVLHHIKNSQKYFENEALRVTKKRVILIEETYDSFFQKIHLVFRDWYVNKKANQPVKLYWGSYFSRKRMTEMIKRNNLVVIHRTTQKHQSYFKELLVLDLLSVDSNI